MREKTLKNLLTILLSISAASLAFSASAQTQPPSPVPLHPSALPVHAPPHPGLHPAGPHKHADHGKTALAAVAKHAAVSCDTMAHSHVAAVNQKAFLTECNASHHHVLTHVKPHPDAHKL